MCRFDPPRCAAWRCTFECGEGVPCSCPPPVPPAAAPVARAALADDSDDDDDGGATARRWIKELSRNARDRMSRRLAPASSRKLRTVTKHFKRFKKRTKQRTPFVVPRNGYDLKRLLHNEWTLMLFTEYLAVIKGARTRRPLAADTIAEYVGMLKVEKSVEYGFAIAGEPQRLPQLIKGLRRDRPKADRRKRRGLRRAHLRAAWRNSAHLRSDTPNAVNDFAAAATAWQAVARGGEVATWRRDLKDWRSDWRPTRADLSFGARRGARYAQVMLRPIKARNGALKSKVPILFVEGDGGGDDAYFHLRRLVRLDPCTSGHEARTPLFRHNGQPLSCERLARTARRIWKAAGVPTDGAGAHVFRIGGATDLADQGASEMLLRAKGRWASDIGRIYARMTRRAQLAASRAMQQRGGRDLEEIFPSFVQDS